MNASRQAPTALKIVAWLFIISGVLAAIEILVSLTRSHINLNFGVLGIFIGQGLLRYSRGWRTCALVFIWLAMILIPVVALLILGGARPITTVRFFGQPVGYISPQVALVFGALALTVSIWQYRVLIRRDVVRLFYEIAVSWKQGHKPLI